MLLSYLPRGLRIITLATWTVALSGGVVGSHVASAQERTPQAPEANILPCGPDNTSTAIWRMVTLPAVAEEREIEVGGSILSTAQAGIAEAGLKIIAEATAQGKRAGANYTITIPATELPVPSGYNNILHPVRGASFRYEREKGERHGLSKPDISIYVDPANEGVLRAKVKFGLSSQDIEVPGARFSVSRCLKMNTKGFRREILYSGGNKGSLQLQYREYMNDYARPAFSQELSYDLAAGKDIGFKGARIRVLNISNVGLRYMVLKPLPDASGK